MYNKYNMEKEIKKITINFSYSNWGYFEDLYRDFIVFTKDNVLFIRMPLDQSLFSDKRKIKCYDMDLIFNEFGISKSDYDKNFRLLSRLIECLKDGNADFCDAEPCSIDIEYNDGTSKTLKNLPFYDGQNERDFEKIINIAHRYIPSEFKSEYVDEDETDVELGA